MVNHRIPPELLGGYFAPVVPGVDPRPLITAIEQRVAEIVDDKNMDIDTKISLLHSQWMEFSKLNGYFVKPNGPYRMFFGEYHYRGSLICAPLRAMQDLRDAMDGYSQGRPKAA